MAREQRKDVDYFPHECVHGRKMHIIQKKYKNDGYATWFKLLEELGKANNHYIDFSDETTLMFLASTFDIDEELTISILTDLAKLGAIDKFLFEEHNIIFSQKFTNSIEDAYRKRKSKIFQYSDILNEINKKNIQSTGSLTSKQVITPEVIRKEEKSKEKETKEESNSHFGDKSPTDISEEIQQPEQLKNQEKEKKSSAKKKETPHWKSVVEQWFNFYKCHFIVSPTFNAVEGKHLKSIIERCETLAKAKDESESIAFLWTEDRALRTLEKFLLNAWSDKWLQEHFLLKNLSSNFDAIINKKTVENGNKQQTAAGTKKQFRFNTSEAIKTITGKD